MPGTANDGLWGDISLGTDFTVAPYAILREYAATLGPRTKNLVTAKVTRHANPDRTVALEMELVAPLLGNASVRVMVLLHDLEKLYPLRLYSNWEKTGRALTEEWALDESELRAAVERVLSDQATADTVKALLAQSLAEVNEPGDVDRAPEGSAALSPEGHADAQDSEGSACVQP